MESEAGEIRRLASARLVLGARVGSYLAGWIVLSVAGVAQTPPGVAILVWYMLAAGWAALGLATRRRIAHWPAFVDVLAPSLTGVLVGHNPSSLHLLVVAQVAGALLYPRGRETVTLAFTGAAGIVAGMILDGVAPLAPLPPDGYPIAEVGAVVMGLLMGFPVVARMAYLGLRSQRGLAEDAERERRAAEMQRRFLSIVSHELRTPLASILGFSQLLDSDTPVDHHEVAEFAHAINAEANHLSRLVDDLLDHFRLDLGRLSVTPTAVDAVQIVARVVGSRVEPEVVADPLPDGAWVLADADRFYQVIRNLVDNACRYGRGGVRVGVGAGPDRTVIWVEDDGPGLPPDKVDDLFGPYTQMETGQGLGLGLSIARRLTEAMDGTLVYDGRADGARFVVTIPTCSSSVEPSGCGAMASPSLDC
jgi:signal transduction histidine kinase